MGRKVTHFSWWANLSTIQVNALLEPPINRLKELRSDAVSIKTRAAITKNEKLFLELVISLIDGYVSRNSVLKAKLEANPSSTHDLIEPVVNEFKGSVNYVNELLRLVQKSHPINLPLGTEGLIKDLSSKLTSNNLEFFLNVSHSQEYSTHPDLLKDVVQKIKLCGGSLPESYNEKVNLVLITFFANQSNDILRHSVFAHELGHVLIRFDSKYGDGFNRCISLLQQKYDQFLEKHKEAIAKDSSIESQLTQVVRRWAEEFFVDLVSIHGLGPSAFLSMKEMGLEETDFSRSLGLTHPAFNKRIYMMWTALQKSNFLDLLPQNMKLTLESYVEYCSDFTALDQAHHKKPFLGELNTLFDKQFLDQFVDEFLSLNLIGKYTPESYKSEVDDLVTLFEEGIAACELPILIERKFKDVSGASILNAAWVIEDKKTLPLDKLNPILNKALANHYLKMQWEAAS